MPNQNNFACLPLITLIVKKAVLKTIRQWLIAIGVGCSIFLSPHCLFSQSDTSNEGQYVLTVQLDNIRAERQGSHDGPLWGFVEVKVWQLNDWGQREREIIPTAGNTKIWDKPNEGSSVRIDRNGSSSKGTVPNTTLDFWIPDTKFDNNRIIIETKCQLFTSHKDNDFASTGYPKMPNPEGKEMYVDCIKSTKLSGYLPCNQTLSYWSDSDRPYNFTIVLSAGILKAIPSQPQAVARETEPAYTPPQPTPTEQTQATEPSEPQKTKAQRTSDAVETGVQVVGGLLNVFNKRKEEKDKKRTAQESSNPEPVASQPNATPQQTEPASTSTQTTPSHEGVVQGAIVWQQALTDRRTTENATLEVSACIETSELVNTYTLLQNGEQLPISRGLVARKTNDCPLTFVQTVTLKNGENKFQLIAQTNKGVVKSSVFTTFYTPSSSNTASVTPSANRENKTRRLALVIGNADYGGGNTLKNPINDASDMAIALKELGFEVLKVTNTTYRKMDEIMDEFGSKIKDCGVVFFYYAGHGLQVEGANYLVPIDAKPQTEKEVKYDCYDLGKLLAKMDTEEASNRANIIVLDACRDNPMKRSWSRSTGGGGLANMSAPSGTFIGFATAPGSTAADGASRNGIYTAALLENIRKPNVTVLSLFTTVNGTVKKMTNNQQTPWLNSSLTEDLFLVK